MSAAAPDTALGAPPRAAEIVRRLELTLARRSDSVLHGDHGGRVPGLGSEAGETRRYVPGDDPRRIDWNVTARARTPHVRDAVAERELESWLVVDLSASTDFGTARCTKRDLVVAAAGALDRDHRPLGRGPDLGEALDRAETTGGRPNEDAARAAADAGVAVDTIAFGTPEGVIDDPLGGTTPVPVAPRPLADIAAATGGTAFEAGSLGELSAVYADIGRVVGHDEVDRDVSDWFVGAGLALLVVAASLSLLWFQRLP